MIIGIDPMNLLLKKILPVLIVLFLANLACNFPTGDARLPEQIPSPTPTLQLEGEGESGIREDAATGSVTIVITEYDLTGLVSAELNAIENPPLQNPQVLLRDGQIEVTGQVQTGPFQSNMHLVAVATVDPDGTPIFEIVSVNLGPIPLSAPMRDELSSLANDIFYRSIASQIPGYRAERIDIEDGRTTITASPQ